MSAFTNAWDYMQAATSFHAGVSDPAISNPMPRLPCLPVSTWRVGSSGSLVSIRLRVRSNAATVACSAACAMGVALPKGDAAETSAACRRRAAPGDHLDQAVEQQHGQH